MATFYKGAGIGTHWHIHDSRSGLYSDLLKFGD